MSDEERPKFGSFKDTQKADWLMEYLTNNPNTHLEKINTDHKDNFPNTEYSIYDLKYILDQLVDEGLVRIIVIEDLYINVYNVNPKKEFKRSDSTREKIKKLKQANKEIQFLLDKSNQKIYLYKMDLTQNSPKDRVDLHEKYKNLKQINKDIQWKVDKSNRKIKKLLDELKK